MRILNVVGARPNFMKVAPIIAAFRQHAGVEQKLIHTGQHFDERMSDVFFRDLEMPYPDEHLHIGGGSHAEQTAKIMLTFEPVLLKYKPDWLLVVGDVNSTLACALVASKLGVKIAHVEAGLRSGDMSMPEEVNRRLTDVISDLLLIPSEDARENLLREGACNERIKFVGNVMIDSLVNMLPFADRSSALSDMNLPAGEYVLVTLHRPSNVDDLNQLREICVALRDISTQRTVVFPVHPRTRQRIETANITMGENVKLVPPLGYLDFMAVMKNSALVVTDSGGVQEETTYLGIPCLTVRPNTERPVTITQGTNQLVAPSAKAILSACRAALGSPRKSHTVPDLWDGKAAERIVREILNYQPGAGQS